MNPSTANVPNHPRTRSMLRLGLLAFALATPAGATTFSQFFNNGPTGTTPHQDKNANTWSWQAAIGPAAIADATLASGDGYATGVSQGGGATPFTGSTSSGFLFTVPASGSPGVSMLYTTSMATSDAVQNTPIQPANNTAANSIQWYRDLPQSLAALTVSDVSQLSVFTRPQSTSTVMRFAIRVNGVWHVSENAWQQTVNTSWEQQTIVPASVQWRSEAFSSGFLDDDLSNNPLVTLPSDGLISGYGVYADTDALADVDARIRIDAFQITTPFVDPYLTWTAGPFANPFTNTDPLADDDRDGLENLLEFVFGGDPTASDQPAIHPAILSADGGDLVVRFRRSDISETRPTQLVLQVSPDLATWAPANETIIGPVSGSGPNGVSYVVDDAGEVDTVTATIPKNSAAATFVRLVAR